MRIAAKNRKMKSPVAAFILCLAAGLLFADAGSSEAVDDGTEAFSMELLRDPFWPVGYFPDDWKSTDAESGDPLAATGTDWGTPASQIRVSGTSRMNHQTVAIINGEMKAPGDLIVVRYNGRIYQWKLKEIKPGGRVRLERYAVQADTGGF